MSEELNVEKKCNSKAAFVLSIVALVVSVVALIVSTLPYWADKVGLNLPAVSSQGGKVVISKQFDKGQSIEKALKTEKPMVVFFYTDWCGFCQRFAPHFNKIVKSREIKKNLAVAYVNCEKEENHKYMEEYDVHGFPTVYVVKKDGSRVHLDNATFFNDDTEKVVKKNLLEAIEEEKPAE